MTFQVSRTTLSKTIAPQPYFRKHPAAPRSWIAFFICPAKYPSLESSDSLLPWLSCPFHANITMTTPSSGSPPPSSVTPNNITLHVLSPAPEVTGGRITFSSISLDTTISQLKARLQNSITGRPLPERQRLIYRGRALGDGSLSLKTVFQSEVS